MCKVDSHVLKEYCFLSRTRRRAVYHYIKQEKKRGGDKILKYKNRATQHL
jgi:hypothetical protein